MVPRHGIALLICMFIAYLLVYMMIILIRFMKRLCVRVCLLSSVVHYLKHSFLCHAQQFRIVGEISANVPP